MAEHNVFEARLRAALVRHVADGPTDFDALGFARQVAAKEPRRRGLSAALAWRSVTVSRLAWVLLLAAALLAALVGGALVAGSQLQRLFPAVVPPIGQLYECPPGSNPDEPGPVDQARPAEEFSATAFDRRAGRLVGVIDIADGTALATWTFDVCTNTWTQMHPNREPPGFEWAQLVYDVDSEATIGVSSEKLWAYDLKANAWTEKGVAPPGAYVGAYDPVSGLVVAGTNAEELWSYDVETDTWALIHQANGPPWGYGTLAYDASVDRLVEYVGGDLGYEIWLLDIRTGTWSRSGAEAPGFFMGLWGVPPVVAYDEAMERTVFGSPWRLAAYDATADRWEILVEVDPGGPSLYHPIAYDPLNRRFVGWDQDLPGAVVAFDLETRGWTVLLDRDPTVVPWPRPTPAPTPGEGQPATPEPTSARTAAPSGGTEKPALTSPVPTASPTSTP